MFVGSTSPKEAFSDQFWPTVFRFTVKPFLPRVCGLVSLFLNHRLRTSRRFIYPRDDRRLPGDGFLMAAPAFVSNLYARFRCVSIFHAFVPSPLFDPLNFFSQFCRSGNRSSLPASLDELPPIARSQPHIFLAPRSPGIRERTSG